MEVRGTQAVESYGQHQELAVPPFSVEIEPNWQELLSCIRREKTPDRVHFFETHIDVEVRQAIAARYGLLPEDVGPSDPFYEEKLHLAVQRFLGYDYVRAIPEGVRITFDRMATDDTAAMRRDGGRAFANESRGMVSTWEAFESFPWPDPQQVGTRSLEWYSENLPEDMCIMGEGGVAHLPELMGYETFCYALHEQPDLVAAISKRLEEIAVAGVRKMLEFDRVKMILVQDDMGFKTGPLASPDALREYLLPIHKSMARAAREANRPYLFHCCGKIDSIMEYVIEEVGITAKHSFEDVIESVVDAKARYGDRIAVLGGIDVDFLCKSSEEEIRRRVRSSLQQCMPGGGYCLGTGNSVANFIPLDSYLAMLDEGRKFSMDSQE